MYYFSIVNGSYFILKRTQNADINNEITIDTALNINMAAGRHERTIEQYVSSEYFNPIDFGISFDSINKRKSRNLPSWW